MVPPNIQRIGLGGGCHWCTEGVFQSLRGVTGVDQGYIRSAPPADTWAEAVIVSFDPAIISLSVLIDVHLRTHGSETERAPQSKYRSAVYVHDDEQASAAEAALADPGNAGDRKIATRVLPLVDFKPSDERYRNYYRTDPERPFCRRFIDPKLDLLRREFSAIYARAERPPGNAQPG